MPPHPHPKYERQYSLPTFGKSIAYQANRTGVAERFTAPAVQERMEMDLDLIEHYDHLLSDLDL
jgi:hypothetical protein